MQYLEVLIAAIAAFLLGFLWYTALFGKAWQAETGVTDEQAQKGIAVTHGTAFLMMCLIAMGLSHFLHAHSLEEQTFAHGALHGVQVAVLFTITGTAINYAYQKKSLKLWLIDAGYLVAFIALEGGVLLALKMFTGAVTGDPDAVGTEG